jgi:hypothetical protein
MIPVQDEITIVHVVTPDVAAVVDIIVADPIVEDYITASVPNVTETVIIESEPRKDAARPPCQIELYKEAIGVIEKHSREPTAI